MPHPSRSHRLDAQSQLQRVHRLFILTKAAIIATHPGELAQPCVHLPRRVSLSFLNELAFELLGKMLIRWKSYFRFAGACSIHTVVIDFPKLHTVHAASQRR